MRTGPSSKRGRNRGNHRRPSSRSQTFDSNGPNVRIRGNAYQVLEKYLALARDASAAGDRISAENYYQHAEHYFRLVNATNGGQPRPYRVSTPADQVEPVATRPDETNGSGQTSGKRSEQAGDETDGQESDGSGSEQVPV